MADSIRPSAPKNEALAWLASRLQDVDRFARKPFGYDNPPVAMLSDLLGVPAIQRTAERAAYGEPLTTGKGWTTRMRPDTEEALLSAPQFIPPLAAVARATKGLPVGMAIKPKGGNWLDGSVEDALKPLNVRVRTEGINGHTAENTATDSAINDWITKKLTRYIKNEMATPEDPLRALAERGVTHREHLMPREDDISGLADVRVGQDFPAEGYGQSPQAQAWEALADAAVDEPARAGERWGEATLAANPWLRKVTPETPVYGDYLSTDNLGFSHLIDELRNATNPASGLPRELLLKYDALPKVTVPQAVERVSNINAWRAAQKAEADLMRANNAATVLHKEYPDKGFKWVELKHNKDLEGPGYALDEGGTMRDPGYKALEDALKYEGDTMGHCVGGYCPDVIEGRSRIFSLRDAKGQPHTTIEIAPGRREGERAVDYRQLLPENYAAKYGDDSDLLERIVQIKGKQNRAPNPEYLPYVQDFVKSGRWSEVGDLSNAGLMDISSTPKRQEALGSRFVTEKELTDYLDKFGDEPKAGFAQGGPVASYVYDEAKIDAILNSLREELHG